MLVPEGRLVITGFNPASLWVAHQWRSRLYQRVGFGAAFLPESSTFIGAWRLRDWLHLLSFELELQTFGCYRPSFKSEKWLQRFDWIEPVGKRWWPVLGASYFLLAVKRVRGMRVLGPAWKVKPVRAGKSVSVANCQTDYEWNLPNERRQD